MPPPRFPVREAPHRRAGLFLFVPLLVSISREHANDATSGHGQHRPPRATGSKEQSPMTTSTDSTNDRLREAHPTDFLKGFRIMRRELAV
jgi:hypothetical protein